MASRADRRDSKIQSLIDKRDFAAAETLIQGMIASRPEDADAHYHLGVLRYFEGKIPDTIRHLRKALEIDPRHADASICLSVLFNDIGRYDQAKTVFERANHAVANRGTGEDPAVDRKFAVKHLELADLYFRYRRYDEAIEEYAKAAVLDPTSEEIRIRRAKAFAKKGFLTRAIQELQQLKHDHPRSIPVRIQLGLLHYSQNNVLDAELEWEGAVEIDSTHPEARAYLEMARQARMAQA